MCVAYLVSCIQTALLLVLPTKKTLCLLLPLFLHNSDWGSVHRPTIASLPKCGRKVSLVQYLLIVVSKQSITTVRCKSAVTPIAEC